MKVNSKEIREKSSEQLNIELTEKTRHLFDLRTKSVTEKLEDTSQLGKVRREVARIKTILRQRQEQAAK